MEIRNLAPDSDCIVIVIGETKVTIWRDGISDTFVDIEDEDGSEYRLILGEESETHKL